MGQRYVMEFQRRILRPLSTSSGIQLYAEQVFEKTVSAIGAVKELHARLIRTQLHTDPSSISDVIRSYSLSPATLIKARFVFHQIEQPPLPIYNLMIRALSQSDRPGDALLLFDEMRDRGVHGNNLTFIFILKGIGRVKSIVHGCRVHVHLLKLGFGSYLYVCNALIHMYALCGRLDCARRVFEEMPERDLVSWNSLICGYSQWGKYKEVLGLFDAMRAENLTADSVTMVKVILACSHLGDRRIADSMVCYIRDCRVEIDVYLGNTLIDMYGRFGSVVLAREIFDQMEERNVVSWNAMITGYTKMGALVQARKLFDEMPIRDVISWTSMITGYSQAARFSDALTLFREMMRARVKPDEVTVASVLSACAHLGAIDVGKAVHDYIRKHNIKEDVYVGNSLIDMYCKCGSVETALEVFREMQKKDSVSWTSVIAGLAVNGNADYALQLFSQMLGENFEPTHGTFVGVLQACAHAGLVDKGLEYFESMEETFGLLPEMKHYGCVVDLLSRSGNLERAYEFMKGMPITPDVVLWRTLLGACKLHGNVLLAEIATNRLLEVDRNNSGNYVLSSNTYAGAGRWEDAMNMRNLLVDSDVHKPPGWSTLEVNG